VRFHVLGIPHTASNSDWICCAFTQKVVKLCVMLKRRGHHVIHYGNAASNVSCDESVTITEADELGPPAKYLEFDITGALYQKFFIRAIREIAARKQRHDFLLCMWGSGHQPVADAHRDLLLVEPGIGYVGGHFAPFKVFESYAILHAYFGLNFMATNGGWYDVVIPNYFEPEDFRFETKKEDYLLFLGRINTGKGIHIALEVAAAADMPIVVAGPGEFPTSYRKAEFVGIVNQQQRAELLARARALIAPSIFLEPFCGVVTEAHFSGTPTITSDWGSFAENNLHGLTGYRCRTFEQFYWAAKNIDRINPHACYQWARQNFAMDRVGNMYEEFWVSVLDVYEGNGWYESKPNRIDLDARTKLYPFS
jgi:glycosyltransferase involved in cell wall biosynthesis